MEDKKLFLIGEVAKMFHISMGTLRHYEQAGLLTPEYTDPDTGYRYYGTRQFELLNTIRYLRVLDFPLAQIKTFLDNRDTDVIEEKLVHQKEVIARKQKELELISRKIDHRLEQLRDAMNSRLDVIQTVEIPESRVVWLRDSLHPKTGRKSEGISGFYGKDRNRDLQRTAFPKIFSGLRPDLSSSGSGRPI